MRAIAALLVFLGPACALAQDPPAAEDLGNRGIQLAPWRFEPAPQPTARGRSFGPWNSGTVELAGRPSSVCSVKLQEMPIPPDIRFTMKVEQPPKIDETIFAKPPAPACS